MWLRETENGLPYLVALDPASGIMVIDAPPLSARDRARRRRGRVFDSFDMIRIPQEVAQQASELEGRTGEARIASLPVECVLAVPDHDEVPLERLGAADRAMPILTRTDLTEQRLPGRVAARPRGWPAAPAERAGGEAGPCRRQSRGPAGAVAGSEPAAVPGS